MPRNLVLMLCCRVHLAAGIVVCAALLLTACSKEKPADPVARRPAAPAPAPEKIPPAAALTEIGRLMFFDKSLSASGQQSCASCHDPAHAFGPPNALAVQPGGPTLHDAGTRAVPSLRYGQNIPPFTEHFYEDDGNDSNDQGPTGGHTWDGRAQSVHDQARLPLLSPREMANTSPAAVAAHLAKSSYAPRFRAVFGAQVFEHPDAAFQWGLVALETYQQSPRDFYPYDSKYDAFLRGQVTLSRTEARGLAAFNDPARGNCASCHQSRLGGGGAFPAFSDYGFIALGVPRNASIPANADARYFDLGLCGPARSDLKAHNEYCGLFRTPSLRNVATRQTFFHNGAVHRLEDAVRFYAERDTRPEKWYPRNADGSLHQYDDLPAAYQQNIHHAAPFGRQPSTKPALSEADIHAIVAFLHTLTDGYQAH